MIGQPKGIKNTLNKEWNKLQPTLYRMRMKGQKRGVFSPTCSEHPLRYPIEPQPNRFPECRPC